MKAHIVNSAGAAFLILAIALAGGTEALGAHPRWATDVPLYAVPFAVALTVLLVTITRFPVWFAILDLSIAAFVVWIGKRMFVESSGDNVLAGQMWFFGWIAVCACASAVMALAVRPETRSGAD